MPLARLTLRAALTDSEDQAQPAGQRARHVAWIVQRAACIVLGSAIIIDALTADKPITELIIGCVVLGVLPIDTLADMAERVMPSRRQREP